MGEPMPVHIPHSVVRHVMCNLLNIADEQWTRVSRIELTPQKITVKEFRQDDDGHIRIADDDPIIRVMEISYRGES